MRKKSIVNRCIQGLKWIYRALFRIPENLDHYSENDYRAAERKFLRRALEQRKIEIQGGLSRY